MPTATALSGWKLHNFGPATTTFTAPTSCLTAYPETRIGRASDIAAWADWTWQDECLWDRPVVTDCRETALAQQSLQAFITEGRARVSDVYTIIYQSPGVACPSGYLTVGGAEKVETSTKYSGAFNVSESAFDMLISALDPGESAVLCCPSDYKPWHHSCVSNIPKTAYQPSVGCEMYYSRNTSMYGWALQTVTFTTSRTIFAPSEIPTLAGAAYQRMEVLIHKSSDLANALTPTFGGTITDPILRPTATPTTTEPGFPTASPTGHYKSATAAIAGGVVGGVSAIILVIVAMLLWRRRQHKRKAAARISGIPEAHTEPHYLGTSTTGAYAKEGSDEKQGVIMAERSRGQGPFEL